MEKDLRQKFLNRVNSFKNCVCDLFIQKSFACTKRAEMEREQLQYQLWQCMSVSITVFLDQILMIK